MAIDETIIVRPAGGPPDPGYRVVQERYGTAVYGLVPLSHMDALVKLAELNGYTIMDLSVASALGATLALTSPGGAWRAEIEENAALVAGDDQELRWTLGCDTGRSSALILYTLGSSRPALARASTRIARNGSPWAEGAIPHDADDLGRCIRLLDLFPGWRQRLGEMAEKYPEWSPLVRQWGELEALYRQELPSGSFPQTDARLRALGEEADPVPAATVDLSGPDPARWPEEAALWAEHEGRLYRGALDYVLDVMIDRHEELPDRLYVGIPPYPGARILLWSRHRGDSTVERVVRRAQEASE